MAKTRHDPPDGSTAGAVVTSYLAQQYAALTDGDAALRRGPEAVHPTRVATRRLRSTLRVFTRLFDPAAARRLDHELAWYAALLGEVRDRQVQRTRFAAAIAEMPPEQVLGPVASRIDDQLSAEQLHHHAELVTALTGARYATLLTTMGVWATEPPMSPAAGKDAERLHRYVKTARRKATDRLTAALDKPDDEEALHGARKAAKRARYAVELIAPTLDPTEAAELVESYKNAQDVLGEHQDSLVAADLLRELVHDDGANPGTTGFTYGLLYAREQDVVRRTRELAAELAGQPPYAH